MSDSNGKPNPAPAVGFRTDRILIAGTIACVLFLAWSFVPSGSRTHSLSLAVGSRGGLRYAFGELLARRARAVGLVIRSVETRGSGDALESVASGTIDFAFVQGGLSIDRHSAIRQIAALQVEPLHLIAKSEFADAITADLDALRGHTVNLSDPGSGTHRLALEVLWFAGVLPLGETQDDRIRFSTLGPDQLDDIATRAELPDAAFLVSAMPSPTVRRLVREFDYRLIPLPFSEAFSLDALRSITHPAMVTTTSPSTDVSGVSVERSNVYETEIPPFAYSVDPDVPAAPTRTLGTRLLLVGNERVSSEAVQRLLSVLFTTDMVRISRPPLDPSLLALPPEYPLHAGTQLYMQRNKPIIAGDLLDYWEKSVSIGAAVAGGLFFAWQWLNRRYQRERDLSFAAYVRKVNELEREARKLERTSNIPLRELMLIQRRIAQLKREAVDKFAEGKLAGEELFSSFLAVVNDARDYVTRLIIHERDNLEREARKRDKPFAELWTEMIGDLDDPLEPAINHRKS